MDGIYKYDVIVVGGGHAGIEAALACSRIGFRTLLLTMNLDTIGLMPCNPSIGGPGKGHLVREVDALGGQMARTIDNTYIHIKMLNTSKGPAVQALRAQADKYSYAQQMKHVLINQKNLFLRQGMVKKLIFNFDECEIEKFQISAKTENSNKNSNQFNPDDSCNYAQVNNSSLKTLQIEGVQIETKETFYANAVILTTGTFLNGLVHIGNESYSAGRMGEFAATGLTDSLKLAGFQIGRLKTGTVARVNSNTIDFSKCNAQPPSDEPLCFSYFTPRVFNLKQIPCWTTYTNELTHEVIRQNQHLSPLFSGKIVGVGPRNCPSIEDKIRKFAGKDHHPVFIEPEGLETNEVYLQGMSTCLPVEVQIKMLRTIKGLEDVEIMKPGYAIEYDFVNTLQLFPSLMSKLVKGLFLAGQINGTTGYEEAAAQGIIAGINATALLRDLEPLILKRSEAYIGVLIDELVTKGVTEPFRIFTSRVEHRLSVRFDNADDRLSSIGNQFGLLPENDLHMQDERRNQRENLKIALKTFHVKQNRTSSDFKTSEPKKCYDAIKDPKVGINEILNHVNLEAYQNVDCDDIRRIETEIKYEGYIKKQESKIVELSRMDNMKIPTDFDFLAVSEISTESRIKLDMVKPLTIGQAKRIQGMSLADIAVLIYNIKRPKVN